jgi:S-DNA-T family DNA segregation ATPase FtsK/SpoIIIE
MLTTSQLFFSTPPSSFIGCQPCYNRKERDDFYDGMDIMKSDEQAQILGVDPVKAKTKAAKRSLSFSLRVGRELSLIAILGSVVFFYVALFSFNPFDTSLISSNFPPVATTNLAGTLGANLAACSVFFFGITAVFLPLPLLHFCAEILRPTSFSKILLRFSGWALLLVNLSVIFAGYVANISVSKIPLLSGGQLGLSLFSRVKSSAGEVGIVVVAVTLILMGIANISELNLVSALVEKLIAWFKKFIHFFAPLNPCRIARTLFGKAARKEHDAGKIPAVELAPSQEVFEVKEEPPSANLEAQPLIVAEEQMPEIFFEPDPVQNEARESKYRPPSQDIFVSSGLKDECDASQRKHQESTAEQLVKVFSDFGVTGEVIAIQPGPAVTVYEFQATAGTKLSKITSLTEDVALALKVDSIFIHPVSGKNAVGVQIPNAKRDVVYFGDIVKSSAFKSLNSALAFVVGKTLKGDPFCADLATMPHLLTAGQTGSGKSVAINSLICSIIMKSAPEEVKMILVDPKILELKIYEGIPHLLMPVITEPKRASVALKWATQEMDRRYRLMELAQVRHIQGFNSFWASAGSTRMEEIRRQMNDGKIGPLPYVVIVIDELADLMLTASKDVESSIQRLAQKARACGIHLVLATQRPSVDVITGVIKANLPSRIAFKVFSRADSRTILDSMGADKLLGKGDMLYLKPGSSRLERLQGAFLEDAEVIKVVESLKENYPPQYDEGAMAWIDKEVVSEMKSSDDSSKVMENMDEDEPHWDEACRLAEKHGAISASFLQRQLKIGYNRAARVVETMEQKGLVGPADGSKPRRWLGGVL